MVAEVVRNLVVAWGEHIHVKIRLEKLMRTPAGEIPQASPHQMVANACVITASVGVAVGLRR